MASTPRVAAQHVARETLSVINWNNACSVALTHFGYPRLGEAIVTEPVYARIGALTLPPGNEIPVPHWRVSFDGANLWDADVAKNAQSELHGAGYTRAGYIETIRLDPAGREDLGELLKSTTTFGLRLSATDLPNSEEWRLAQAYYAPTDQCALLVYSHIQIDQPGYDLRLVHLYATNTRIKRARIHLENGLVLAQTGDLDGALAETETAAHMTPLDHSPRYHHAALLCLLGHPNEALTELKQAITLDPQDAARAKKDADFETLRDDQRFQALVSSH